MSELIYEIDCSWNIARAIADALTGKDSLISQDAFIDEINIYGNQSVTVRHRVGNYFHPIEFEHHAYGAFIVFKPREGHKWKDILARIMYEIEINYEIRSNLIITTSKKYNYIHTCKMCSKTRIFNWRPSDDKVCFYKVDCGCGWFSLAPVVSANTRDYDKVIPLKPATPEDLHPLLLGKNTMRQK